MSLVHIGTIAGKDRWQAPDGREILGTFDEAMVEAGLSDPPKPPEPAEGETKSPDTPPTTTEPPKEAKPPKAEKPPKEAKPQSPAKVPDETKQSGE